MYTLKDARIFARTEFLRSDALQKNPYDVNSAALDADVLLSFLLKKERSWLLVNGEADFSEFKTEFNRLVQKRCLGLPVAYITNAKEFYGRTFYVNQSVLIPKPDTELLVEAALSFLKIRLNNVRVAPKQNMFSILDMCTGSGCVGISVAAEFYTLVNKQFQNSGLQAHNFIENNFSLLLADISYEALSVCKKNVETLLPYAIKRQTETIQTDLRNPFPLFQNKKYGIILANPPYVPSKTADRLLSDGRSEPRSALDGGEDGLDLIRPFVENAFTALAADGKVFMEIGEYNASAALRIFKRTGFKNVSILQDLSGNDRVITAELTEPDTEQHD